MQPNWTYVRVRFFLELSCLWTRLAISFSSLSCSCLYRGSDENWYCSNGGGGTLASDVVVDISVGDGKSLVVVMATNQIIWIESYRTVAFLGHSNRFKIGDNFDYLVVVEPALTRLLRVVKYIWMTVTHVSKYLRHLTWAMATDDLTGDDDVDGGDFVGDLEVLVFEDWEDVMVESWNESSVLCNYKLLVPFIHNWSTRPTHSHGR